MFPDRSDGTGGLTRSLVSGADGRRPSIPRPSLRPRPGRDRRRHRPALRRHRRRRPRRPASGAPRTTSSSSTCPIADGDDIYEHAAELLGRWRDEGVLVQDAEPTIWAYEQDYDGSGRRPADPPRLPRPDRRHRLRPRARPPPRADPARARRRTASVSPGPPATTSRRSSSSTPAMPGASSPRRSPAEPFCEVTDPDGTVHRAWPIADPAVHDAVAAVARRLRAADRRRPPPLRDRPHLRRRGRRRRRRRRPLHARLPRLARGSRASASSPPTGCSTTSTRAKRVALRDTLIELFDLEPIDDPADLVPDAGDGTIAFGYMDSFHRKPYRLRLKDDAVLAAALPDTSEAYRTLDAAALEALILKGPLGDEHRRHRRQARPLLLLRLRRGRRPPRARRGRRGVLPPPDAGRAGPRRRRRRRDDAAEVDLLLPEAAHRDRLQPALPSGVATDEDLHAQGRRRHDRPLVRRPAAEVRRPDRRLRDDRRGRLGARRRPFALPVPVEAEVAADLLDLQRDLFVAGAELAAAPGGGRSARGRRQPDHRRDGRRARAGDRPLHGPGRAAAEVRDPRRHAALRRPRPGPRDPAPGGAPRRRPARRRGAPVRRRRSPT